MKHFLYLQPFLLGTIFSLGLGGLFIFLNRYWKIGEKSRQAFRHIHRFNVSRWGGIVIILSFIGVILVNRDLVISHALGGIILAAFFILVFGVLDDLIEMDWKVQLVFQLALALFIFLAGANIPYITNPLGGVIPLEWGSFFLPGLILSVVWIVVIINALNWLDGIDGLSGSVSFIGVLAIFFLVLKPEVNQPPVGIIAAALAGSIAGFLVFNFYPARILAGTAGSMFLGFILATLAIFSGAKIATTMLVLAIPLLDFIWVIGERWRAKVSIFQPDNRHLHYKLLESGWTQNKIVLLFSIITLLITIFSLNTDATGKVLAAILVALIFVFILVWLRQKNHFKNNC